MKTGTLRGRRCRGLKDAILGVKSLVDQVLTKIMFAESGSVSNTPLKEDKRIANQAIVFARTFHLEIFLYGFSQRWIGQVFDPRMYWVRHCWYYLTLLPLPRFTSV